MFFLLFLITFSCTFANALIRLQFVQSSFNASLYENALDAAECERQLSHLRSDLKLRLQFLDAGLRIPKYINQGNTLEMGNYYGCLGIHQVVDGNTIQGKYCMINVPNDQAIFFPELSALASFSKISKVTLQNVTISEDVKELNTLIAKKMNKLMETSAVTHNVSRSPRNFRMALCIPKPCTVNEGLNELFKSVTAEDFRYEEGFCRLPHDKPWVSADYVAISLFSVIGIMTVTSTLYDLHNQFILHRDSKSINPLYTAFSVYTNARRLTTFSKNPNNLECLDGVRALSMIWIHVLHIHHKAPPFFNVNDYRTWELSLRSIWMTSGPLAVDTFLLMSGMLLVYTKAGRMTSSKLLRNLHLFYLNRIARVFPLLGAVTLLQASFFHWISDGPLWLDMAYATDVCRNYWWLNLLYVNNFFIPICVSVSWYLGVDMQLHMLSPILLYFVLSGSKTQAWVALVVGLLATLTASTIYVFIKQLPGAQVHPARARETLDWWSLYYLNTLPRAAPFFVGMIFGYILHLNRQQKPKLSKSTLLLLWCLTIIMGLSSLYSPEPMKDVNYDNQTVDSLVNAFARSGWATAVAILIVLCINGYGGFVNWFLSLQLWKLISRVSYAMYLFHYPLIILISESYQEPAYFSVYGSLYTFSSIFSISFVVGFAATLIVDSPFSTIFNQLMSGGEKKSQKEISTDKITVSHEGLMGN